MSHVTWSAQDELCIEMWHKNRKLTFYAKTPEYIKSWGPSMITEMEDGTVSTEKEFKSLLEWLEE